MTAAAKQCYQCGRIGPPKIEGEYTATGIAVDVGLFVLLFACFILPGVLFAIWVIRCARAPKRQVCGSCGWHRLTSSENGMPDGWPL